MAELKHKNPTRERMYQIIFESDTWAGRFFNIILLFIIIISIFIVMLDSSRDVHAKYGKLLYVIEWVLTGLFTLEYFGRIYASHRPLRYIFSFYGFIDLIAIIPTYLSLFLAGSQYFLIIRSIRLLRVFRILKLAQYNKASKLLVDSIIASRYRISVFLGFVLTLAILLGSIMYLIESPESGFTSIPRSVYWAIITLTTVGYGDIVPITVIGQAVASFIMLLGYSIIAIPTGIITMEIGKQMKKSEENRKCIVCQKTGHEDDAKFCKHCGSPLQTE